MLNLMSLSLIKAISTYVNMSHRTCAGQIETFFITALMSELFMKITLTELRILWTHTAEQGEGGILHFYN